MKKIILVVLLALGLQGSAVGCQESAKLGLKHNKLIIRALKREDMFAYKVQMSLAIKWLDRALVECPANWTGRRTATSLRDYLLELSGVKKDAKYY